MNGGMLSQKTTQSALDWESVLRNFFREKVTLSFETGKQNRMIISKSVIRALDNPTYLQLLMSMDDLTILLIGTEFRYPDSLRISESGIDPISPYRQMDLARLMERAGWKKGYRYTLNAIILPIGRQPGLCFDLQKAAVNIPAKRPA